MKKKFIASIVFIGLISTLLSGCYMHRNHDGFGRDRHQHHTEGVHY